MFHSKARWPGHNVKCNIALSSQNLKQKQSLKRQQCFTLYGLEPKDLTFDFKK